MVGVTDWLFLLITLSGAGLCGLGVLSYRRWDQLGVVNLTAFTVILGVGNVLAGGLGLVLGPTPTEGAQPWGAAAIFFWAVASVPWLLFTLQYTGRRTQIQRRTVGLLAAPLVIVTVSFATEVTGALMSGVRGAITSSVFIYCFALIFLGTYLLTQSTRSYIHLSTNQGIALTALPVTVVLTSNAIGLLMQTSTVLAVGTYTAALTTGTALFGVALLGDPLLERTPAVERLGEQAITRETDDLIFIVDEADTVVRVNATAAKTLDRGPALGQPLRASLGQDSDELRTRETVTLETTAGNRRYDPQVAAITDSRGEEIGAVCSLRDVTERELREQRLAVLNRVLRHNLRNKVDVVKSHTEALDGDQDGHVRPITEAVDSITELGNQARTIDQFVSDSNETQRVDLVAVIEETWLSLDVETDDVDVTFDLPDAATVTTNRHALQAALESALDNAVSYASASVECVLDADGDGYEITVADDGPGIPDRELRSLDAGTETPLQHGTGLGLWQLQWAVTTIGGELSFDTADGTTVRFTVPNQGTES
jgi:signal transduction histidine kinase